jgi:hypothetical protein
MAFLQVSNRGSLLGAGGGATVVRFVVGVGFGFAAGRAVVMVGAAFGFGFAGAGRLVVGADVAGARDAAAATGSMGDVVPPHPNSRKARSALSSRRANGIYASDGWLASSKVPFSWVSAPEREPITVETFRATFAIQRVGLSKGHKDASRVGHLAD